MTDALVAPLGERGSAFAPLPLHARRVLFLGTWLSRTRGGIENLGFNLFTHLARKGHDIVGFSLNTPEETRFDGNVHYAPSEKWIPLQRFYRAFAGEVRRCETDAVVAVYYVMGFFALIAKKLWGIPYVVYAHGKEVDYHHVLNRFVVKQVYQGADAIVCNSSYTASLCHRLGIEPEKVHVIHPGVGEDFVRESHTVGYTAPGAQWRLYSVSRLVKRKGIGTAISAVRQLRDAGHDVVYRIDGAGEFEPMLRALVTELDLEEVVSFGGRVSEEEKIAHLREADLFLMPSYEDAKEGEIEGFGIVYLEANALGTYVIAGRDGGVPDAVRDGITGSLVDGTDASAVAEAVVNYFARPEEERRLLAEACTAWAREHDWDALTEQLVGILPHRVAPTRVVPHEG